MNREAIVKIAYIPSLFCLFGTDCIWEACEVYPFSVVCGKIKPYVISFKMTAY